MTEMLSVSSPSGTMRSFDAAWRAAAYCLHPKVIGLSLLPLLLCLAVLAALGWWFWSDAVSSLALALTQWTWSRWLFESLGAWDLPSAPRWVAGFLLLMLAVPAVVVMCLLMVAIFLTPAVVKLVAAKRFPTLQPLSDHTAWLTVAWSFGASVLALVAMVLSVPLWLFPPMGLLLPPLIWGWLTYRVMAFDALSTHASVAERQQIMRVHRWPLLGMGVVCGLLGAAPTMLWALSAITIVLAPVMVALSLWIYTLVFAFASLWFAHFMLQALHDMRSGHGAAPSSTPSVPFLPTP